METLTSKNGTKIYIHGHSDRKLQEFGKDVPLK